MARIAGLGLPVTGAIVALSFITGLGGLQGGWLWAPAVATPPLAGVGWLGWGRSRGRVVATATLALGGIALGLWTSQHAVLSHGRLRVAMDSIPVPPSFEPTGDSVIGWSLCFDECSAYSRDWVASGNAEEVQAQLRELLVREGFAVGDWGVRPGEPGALSADGHRGRLGLRVTVNSRRISKDGQLLAPPPGQVGVTVVLDTYSGH